MNVIENRVFRRFILKFARSAAIEPSIEDTFGALAVIDDNNIWAGCDY